MTSGVSIVIPSWNGLELLQRFLAAVIDSAVLYSKHFNSPTEIIIVDDGSVDASVVWLVGNGFVEEPQATRGGGEDGERRKRGVDERRGAPANEGAEVVNDVGHTINLSAPSLRLIRNQSNRGFGEASNRGFEAARYPLVFLLNNDVEIDLNSIAPLVENFADASVFAAHCQVFDLRTGQVCGTGKLGSFARGFIRVHRSYVPAGVKIEGKAGQRSGAPPYSPTYSMFAGGGSAMFDREKFMEIGGFEPLLSPFYWEDVELSYRAWKRGYTVLYEPRSVTRHRISSTIGKLDRRAVRKIEQRNRLIYHWIHLHDWPMTASHISWVVLLALTAPLRLKPGFISSCIAALRRLPEIRKRRQEEKQAARRSDREVFEIFGSLERREDIVAYDDCAELQEASEGAVGPGR